MGMPLPSTSDAVGTMAGHRFTMTAIDHGLPADAGQARKVAIQLAEERRVIDNELAELGQVLRAQNVTMSSPLVDAEGFPISTIDTFAVRTARARIITLRNDRMAIEDRLRALLDVALARQTEGSRTDTGNSQDAGMDGQETSVAMAQVPGTNGALSIGVPVRLGDEAAWTEVGGLVPFARVNDVMVESPAAQAGLQRDDEILQFGHLTAATAHRSSSERDLASLPSAVQIGVQVDVVILRRDSADATNSIRRLRLTPSPGWGGRGLLGCHLLPI